MERYEAGIQRIKVARRNARVRKDLAFKYYVEQKGLAKAKMMAVCIRKRQKGEWVEVDKDWDQPQPYYVRTAATTPAEK